MRIINSIISTRTLYKFIKFFIRICCKFYTYDYYKIKYSLLVILLFCNKNNHLILLNSNCNENFNQYIILKIKKIWIYTYLF